MIRHIVLTKFKAEVLDPEIDSLFTKLADLQNHIPGIRGFDGGVAGLVVLDLVVGAYSQSGNN
ncbi:MAG: Dabb family protein [Rhodospirillales bacterium]|nr:Dabb family protein [Rhodospirillales bacterium]